MLVYGKEITEEQAKYILKSSTTNFIRSKKLEYQSNYDFVQGFERMFDENELSYNPEQLNSNGVEKAVAKILLDRNPRGAFYTAFVLQGSEVPLRLFEDVINQRGDILSQVAYVITLPCESIQTMLDNIAEYAIPYYNMAVILNSKTKGDFTNNFDNIYRNGTMAQLVYLAKYLEGMNIDEIRTQVLNSGDAKANYLFAYHINDTFNAMLKGSENYPTPNINLIYNSYKGLSDKTRQKFIAQHVNCIIKSGSPKFCYKLALNGIIDENPYINSDECYDTLEEIVLRSHSVKYLTKFALEVPGADRDAFVRKVSKIGTKEEIEFLEQSIAFSDFFNQTAKIK